MAEGGTVTYSSKEKLNTEGDQKRITSDGGVSSNTVEVRGLSADTSQEVVEMYFENSRRSGGGDIEEVQIKDGIAYITFVEAETAQRVVSRSSHQVVGQTLNVTLYHPPPTKPCYDNKVLVQELNSAVTEEILTNFLVTETGANVTEILYGEEAGRVVVTLSSCIDFDALRKACRETRIKSTFLKVAKVAISNCILVWNLQLSAIHEVILLYFENKRRSGGGEVERVEMVPEERYCLVYFEDNTVIDRVLSQTHKIDGADVKVHLHHECLGRRSSTDRSHSCFKISNTGNKDTATLDDTPTENSIKVSSDSISSDYDKASDFVEVPDRQINDGTTLQEKKCKLYEVDTKDEKLLQNLEFLLPDALVERVYNSGQMETMTTSLEEKSGVRIKKKNNQVFVCAVTLHQMAIAKHYLEDFCEKRLSIKINDLGKNMSSSTRHEESYSYIDILNEVSEVEYKALEILENGFKRMENIQLSWDKNNAIVIQGPQGLTISIKQHLIRQLEVLRTKQSEEISLDEEEKNVVKDVIEEMPSKDTICVFSEKKNQVVVYSDTHYDIMKFKHRLKFKSGKVKESTSQGKRFTAFSESQATEVPFEGFSSSVRSGGIEKQFLWSKNASDLEVFYTKEYIKVAVYKANILRLPVDCIVNDANDNLQHIGGVSKAIADGAGPELVQQGDAIIRKKVRIPVGCQVTTTAGRLPYKYVIHTVGPRWSDYQPHTLQKVQDCERDLYAAIYGCFTEAERNGLSSVALPAVSSGIYGVPQYMYAVQFARAVLDYSRKSEPGKCLNEIHFIDKLPNLVKLMQDTFRTMIRNGMVPNYNIQNYVTSSSNYQRQQSKDTGRDGHKQGTRAADNSQCENAISKELSPVYYESEEHHKKHFVFQVSAKPVVHIYEGDILKLRNMDAVVCPDDSKGTGTGSIASELLKKPKYKILKEKCFKGKKQNLGDVVIIYGEDNPFKVVVHVVIKNNLPQRQEFKSTIKKSIDSILRKTNEFVLVKTIAMPLFGANLVTEKSWAELFMDRFVAFCYEVKNPNLEEIHIITHVSSSSAYSTLKKVFCDFAEIL